MWNDAVRAGENARTRLGAFGRRARSNFRYAFLFVPEDQRRALEAVYAFCRLVDDAADDAPSADEGRALLLKWRGRLAAVYGGALSAGDPEHALVAALASVARTFSLERAHFEGVIEGCEQDLVKRRYASWEELRAYCELVASSVGLLCIAIFGHPDARARAYATDLGVALQLTNILRDLDEDAARGRIYLPRADLDAFAVTEDDILGGRRTERVLGLLRFEAQRARLHFLRARAAIGRAEQRRFVAAEIMGDIYYALLERLEATSFPKARTRLSSVKKATLALRRYARAHLL